MMKAIQRRAIFRHLQGRVLVKKAPKRVNATNLMTLPNGCFFYVFTQSYKGTTQIEPAFRLCNAEKP